MAKKTKTKTAQKKSGVPSKGKASKKASPKLVKKTAGKQKAKPTSVGAKTGKLKSQVQPKSKVAVKNVSKPKNKINQNIKPQKKAGIKVVPPVKSKAAPVKTLPALTKTIKTPEKVKEKKLTPAENGTGLKLKYSDKDLAEFKGIIIDKLNEARHDLVLLRSSMSHLDDHGTDDTSPTFKLMEDGSDVLTKEETAQLAARQQKFIKHLEDALVRIENKSYGICRVTGNLIPKDRLRVVPHATLSIEAKQKQF